jgi:HlyD family secretion protein
MSRRIGFVLLLILAAVATGAGAIYFLNNRPLTVQIGSVENNVQIQVFGLGTVEAQVISSIGFELGATLVELTADHGSMVKSGDILARLEASEQQSRVARAEASVLAADANLARTSTMIVRQAAVLAQKEVANRRQQDLLNRGVASIEKAEETARDVAVAQADHDLAVADAAVARASLETARADLAHEAALLDHHVLRAPFDAIVVERHKELGSVVKAGDPVYTIVDSNSVWVLVHVDEARSGAIAVGQTADVRLRSLPGAVFQGLVVRIGIESDRVSEERRVWVKCIQCPVDFHLGEQAEAIITMAVLPSALLVPELSVSGYDGRTGLVWIARNGTAHRVRATFGQRTLDGRIEVTGGVPQGAAIITGPASGLREGRAVRIGTAAAP